MTRDWDANKIASDIRRIAWKANDPKLTGWESWPCKQDLYRIKWATEQALASMPEFAGESEWLAQEKVEHQKQAMWKALNEVQTLRR